MSKAKFSSTSMYVHSRLEVGLYLIEVNLC